MTVNHNISSGIDPLRLVVTSWLAIKSIIQHVVDSVFIGRITFEFK